MAWVFDEAWARRWLNSKGWLESVAGEHDFGLAARAVVEYVADPTKGILVLGKAGSGKTLLCDILYGYPKVSKVRIDCSDNGSVDLLVRECDRDANGGVYNSSADEYLDGVVMLDDIGREDIRNSYKNRLDRVGNFISRYCQMGRSRLIMSSNLTGERLSAHYDDRIVDRIMHKCIILKFTGGSKRERHIIV